MLAFLLAGILQISLPEQQNGSIAKPLDLTINVAYPKDYQLVPGSILQSLIQQDSPLPPPFLILKETAAPPSGEKTLQQQLTYQLQPLKTGKTTLLLQAQFSNKEGDIMTAYAAPATLDIQSATSEAPLLPPPYDPTRTLPIPEYSTRVEVIKESQSTSHAQEIASELEFREIPWLELTIAFLLAVAGVWFTLQKVIAVQHSRPKIVTRYGFFRRLQELSSLQDTTSEMFFSYLEEQFKTYFHVPESMTAPEIIDYLKNKKHFDESKQKLLIQLLQLSEQSKFSPLPQNKDNFQKALKLAEEIMA